MRPSVPELAITLQGPLRGRQSELERLAARVRAGGLLSIVGPPGVGKTRLAAELVNGDMAADLEPAFCDLVDARTADDVCAVVARELHVPLGQVAPGDEASHAIGDALAARQLALLVLDNFEHLVDKAASLVSQWAQRAAAVVVTSRQRLGVPGESVLALEPLPPPQEGADLSRSDAVGLFFDRFRASHPDYEPTGDDTAEVAKLVRELDGLPLAIELCAAGAKAPLAKDLRERTAEARTSLDRTIGGSWRLLSPEEQALLARCSVFRGGFERDAAAAVMADAPEGAGPRPEDVAALLDALADKSLLGVQRSPNAEQRYAMLVSIREFCAERLRESGLEAEATMAHARTYLTLGKKAMDLYLAGASAAARKLARAEADNLFAVHRRAVEGRLDPAISPAAALEPILSILPGIGSVGPLASLLAKLDAALTRFGDAIDPGLETRALVGRARVLDHMGRAAEALGSAKLAHDRARELGDEGLSARALDVEGRALLQLGRWREARDALESAIATLSRLGMQSHVARALVALADTAFYVDDLGESQKAYATALVAASRIQDPALIGLASARLAIVEMELGKSEDALARFERALRWLSEADDRAGAAMASTYLAILEHDTGRLESARARLETLTTTTRELAQTRLFGIASMYLGGVLVELGELAEAQRALADAERALGEAGSGSALALARAWRSVVLAQKGDVDGADQLMALATGALKRMQEQSFYARAALLHEGHLDLARARAAAASGDRLAAAAHRASAKRRLEDARAEPVSQTDVRIACRILESALGLPSRVAEQSPISARGSVERALIVEESGAWFRPPHAEPVDIGRRAPLRKILAVLLGARLRSPGKVVPAGDLMRAAWTDTEDVAALQNRLRVAIASLRKLGLSSLLWTRTGGYLLDPHHRVLESSEAPE